MTEAARRNEQNTFWFCLRSSEFYGSIGMLYISDTCANVQLWHRGILNLDLLQRRIWMYRQSMNTSVHSTERIQPQKCHKLLELREHQLTFLQNLLHSLFWLTRLVFACRTPIRTKEPMNNRNLKRFAGLIDQNWAAAAEWLWELHLFQERLRIERVRASKRESARVNSQLHTNKIVIINWWFIK